MKTTQCNKLRLKIYPLIISAYSLLACCFLLCAVPLVVGIFSGGNKKIFTDGHLVTIFCFTLACCFAKELTTHVFADWCNINTDKIIYHNLLTNNELISEIADNANSVKTIADLAKFTQYIDHMFRLCMDVTNKPQFKNSLASLINIIEKTDLFASTEICEYAEMTLPFLNCRSYSGEGVQREYKLQYCHEFANWNIPTDSVYVMEYFRAHEWATSHSDCTFEDLYHIEENDVIQAILSHHMNEQYKDADKLKEANIKRIEYCSEGITKAAESVKDTLDQFNEILSRAGCAIV